MKPHPIQEATSIFIIILGLCLFIKLLMEEKLFLYAIMIIAFIVVLRTLYEYNKGKL